MQIHGKFEGFPHNGALFGLVSYNELRSRHPKSIGSFITQCRDAPFSSQEKADEVKLEAKVSSRECQVATKRGGGFKRPGAESAVMFLLD